MQRFTLLLRQLCLLALVIVIGTIFDWFAHQVRPEFWVPTEYFRHKIIFGTVIGFIAFSVLRPFVRSDFWLAVGVAATVSVLLQTKYFLQGYDLTFVFLFMGIHFIVFALPALFVFRRWRHVLRG